MKKNVLLQLSVYTALMLSFCDRAGEPLVARVGNHRVTLSDFENNFKQAKSIILIKSSTYEDFKAHLAKMVDDRLKLIDAYQRGYEKAEEISDYVTSQTDIALSNRLIELQVVDKLVSEQEMREQYRRNNVQVRARHILLRVENEGDADSVHQSAVALRNRIIGGEAFEEIARQYSQDRITGPIGGSLGMVKWGGVGYDDAFYTEIFRLKVGEISMPVRSMRGFHLIRVDEEKTFFTKPYNEAKLEIKRELLRRRQDESQVKYAEFLQRLRKEYGLDIDSTNVNFLCKKAEEALAGVIEDQTSQAGTSDEFSKISSEDARRVLVSYAGGSIDIDEVVKIQRRNARRRRPQMQIPLEAYSWLDMLIDQRLLVTEAKKRGLHRSPELKQSIRDLIERMMLRRINSEMIRNRVALVDDDYRAYFEEHSQKYVTEAKHQVQEILVRDKDLADQLHRRLLAGENFSTLAAKYTERSSVRGKKGMLGYITANQYGEIGKRAALMNIGEISAVIPVEQRYAIITLRDREGSRPMTYDEAKLEVRGDRQRDEEKVLEEAWLDNLRSKITVQLWEENLKDAFAELKGY